MRSPSSVRPFALLAVATVAAFAHAAAQSDSQQSATRAQFLHQLVAAAVERTHHVVRYDPAYVRIPYPNGDVPADSGVCTDEIIRSYRAVGIDLQKEVHEDMQQNFSAYPRKWHWMLTGADASIDHRRVPNLMVFFSRKGETLKISSDSADYSPGDLVTWDLGGNVPHIGILVDQASEHAGGIGVALERTVKIPVLLVQEGAAFIGGGEIRSHDIVGPAVVADLGHRRRPA